MEPPQSMLYYFFKMLYGHVSIFNNNE